MHLWLDVQIFWINFICCRSVGATLVEMFTKQPPWCELEEFQMMYRIGKKERPQYHLEHSVSLDAREFLDTTFNYNYDRRSTAEDLLKHCWFLTESGECFVLFFSSTLNILFY